MAKYKLYNIRIFIDRDGRRYIRAMKHNMDNPNEKDSNYLSLSYDSRAGEILAPYFSKENNGTGDIDSSIPEHLTYIYGEYKLYTPKTKFYRKRANGEFITDEFGNTKLFDTLQIFCEYSYDEFGEKQYWPKSKLEKRGRQDFDYGVYKGYIIPYSEELDKSDKLSLHNNDKSDFYDDNYYDEEYNYNNEYYDDGLDMDQQSESYWQELGIF